MERLGLRFEDAMKALKTLEEITRKEFSVIIRDAAIQRFEYTFEAFWKFIKEYLKEKEGVVSNSPKACFREIFTLGFCAEKEAAELLEMTDKRNDTSHTYKEEVAQGIYDKIPGYCSLMKRMLEKFKMTE
jgi:nucleotidyltransferase substrate binding protein (TIGR01987 family)